MFSRFFGKSDKATDSPTKEAQSSRLPSDSRLPARPSSLAELERTLASENARMPQAEPSLARAAPTATSTGPSKPVQPLVRVAAHMAAAPLPKPVMTPVAVPSSATPVMDDHQIDFVLPTAPMPLEPELTLEQRKNMALEAVEAHHQRIANTIRTLWGYRECSTYINRLIMAGGDGMGHARVGFNQDAVAAMLALSDIHDAEFGPPSTLSGALGLSI